MNQNIGSENIEFVPGTQIEIYFSDEKIEYRFNISKKRFDKYQNCLIIDLPPTLASSFYKGEDFIKCRYVHNNIVYTFGGEIISIIHETNPCIVVSRPTNIQKSTHRSKGRISTQIVSEYEVIQVVPGQNISTMRGFATIKDASMGGVSFLTTDTLPINTVIAMNLFKENILFVVEIKTSQKVNDKSFYGGRIIDFKEDGEEKFKRYLNNIVDTINDHMYITKIY